jgi:hypothetical protein
VTFPHRPETKLWFALAAATSGLSLAAGILVLRRWLDLVAEAQPLEIFASVVLPVLAVILFRFGPLLAAGRLNSPLPDHDRRVAPVFIFGGLGLLPVTSGMVLVGISTYNVDTSTDAAARAGLDTLVSQRRDLVLFLGVSAFVVVVAVVATAALRRALIAYDKRDDYPASSLLLYGAYFSVLISFLFVPAYLAVQEGGHRVVKALAPVSDTEFPDHSWFERRSDLAELLGLGVSVAGVFAAAFAVLTPVASSALATYLQKDADTAKGDEED